VVLWFVHHSQRRRARRDARTCDEASPPPALHRIVRARRDPYRRGAQASVFRSRRRVAQDVAVEESMKRVVSVLLWCVSASVFAAEPARWTIDYSASKLGFTAEQAEAPFDGSFGKFDADVRFDPTALTDSRAEVTIDTASVATANKDRDGILRGTGWF